MKKILVIVALIVIVGIVSILIFPHEEAVIQKQTQSVPELRVAFIADQGLGPNAIAVLNLIKDEGAQMVLHQGDFDYKDDPDAWDKQISDVLGDDFLYFASIGHHDMNVLSGYQEKLYDRLKKNPEILELNQVVHIRDYSLFLLLQETIPTIQTMIHLLKNS